MELLENKLSTCCDMPIIEAGEYCSGCKEHTGSYMQIPVNFIEDTTVIEVANNHQHTLETDVEDFTDSSGGFTNEITICRVCGQEWAVRGSERDLDDGRYDWAD